MSTLLLAKSNKPFELVVDLGVRSDSVQIELEAMQTDEDEYTVAFFEAFPMGLMEKWAEASLFVEGEAQEIAFMGRATDEKADNTIIFCPTKYSVLELNAYYGSVKVVRAVLS